MRGLRLVTLLALLSLATLALAGSASAHASRNTEDGKYRITWGLLDEPGFTFSKNRLDLIVRELADPAANRTGAGVGGLTPANLTVRLTYLDEVYELGNLTAYRGAKSSGSFAGEGNYTSANSVYLTRPGIYALEIRGDIHGTPVDMTIPAAHDYEPIQEIMFPDEVALGAAGDMEELEARIAQLEAQLRDLQSRLETQAATPATVVPQSPAAESGASPVPGPGLLMGALAAVGAALLLRRR